MTVAVRLRRRAWFLIPLCVASVAALVLSAIGSPVALAADPVPGQAGTDTTLPLTDSAVTINGRGRFAGMTFTINQTAQLSNQAISIAWTGGTPTTTNFETTTATNFVQIFQCWGDDDGTVPDNPGPPPEQCQQGAEWVTKPAGSPAGYTATRVISRVDFANYEPALGFTDLDTRTPSAALQWRPFRAVDGEVIDHQVNARYSANVGGEFWLNPYFDNVSTNEIYAARTDSRGEGAELFEVQTGQEANGLGCGQKVQPVEGGAAGETKVPTCWLVIVPRGEAADENVGTPANQAVATSPLAPEAWANRIAVPLEFNPVDSPCAFGGEATRLAGSELALPAIANWLPTLCTTDGLPPYSYAKSTDSLARQQLTNPTFGSPGMVVVSQPVAADRVEDDNPIVYAPISLSGVVIGFNVERNVEFDAPAEEVSLAGTRVAQINLTPRLVAKLLTQSYSLQIPNGVMPEGYGWLTDNGTANPVDIVRDPDFLRFNPEFEWLQYTTRFMGGLLLPSGNSDMAHQVWEWVFSDPEAAAWMSGAEDEWGMTVNPVFRTKDNPSGAPFGDPVPDSFPKSEPYCWQEPVTRLGITPPPLCSNGWLPYASGLVQAARSTRLASSGAKTTIDQFGLTQSSVWRTDPPLYPGTKGMLALTDTSSAVKYGLQTASLSRAGDDGDDRSFVAADTAGLLAGIDAMETVDSPVLEPVPGKEAPGAYPLTALTYAAIAPLGLAAEEREDYAAFIDYAVGAGQAEGLGFGKLLPGYVPLPATLRSSGALAAGLVRTLVAIPPPAPPPSTAAPTTPVPETTAVATTTTTTASTTPPGGSAGSSSSSSSTSTTTTTKAPTTTQPKKSSPGSGTTTTSSTSSTSTSTTVPAGDAGGEETSAPPAGSEPPPDDPSMQEADTTGINPATPILALSRSRFAVPGLGVVALGSGLGALEITKRPRRGAPPGRPPTPPAAGGA